MEYSLPLNKMTITEKLAAMELLWEDISGSDNNVPSFSWHSQILKDREKLISEGKATFSDFENAKARIRDKVQ